MVSLVPAWIRRSVARQIVLASVGVVAVISLAAGWYGVEIQRDVLVRQMELRGQILADTTAVATAELLLKSDLPVIEEQLEKLVDSEHSVVFARLHRPDGRILRKAGLTAVADPDLVRLFRSTVRAPKLTGQDRGEPIAYVSIGLSTAETQQVIDERHRTLMLQAFATFTILSIVLSLFVRGLVHRPLRALANQARRIGRGDLDTPIALRAIDEFGELAIALDSMRRDLAHSYGQIRQQNEKLREIDRLKSLFLATMSHEIRTPMNGVLGYSQLLLESDLDESQRAMAETVVSSGNYLLTLINGILDLSKIEAGEVELETTEVDVRALIEDVVRILRPEASAKGLELFLDFDPRVPPLLVGDPLRIRQVTTNLLGNAVKFTDMGVVSTRVAIAEESDDSLLLRIAIEDTGPGIDDVTKSRLFQAFSQADPSTTRRYGGTGLGLTIAKHLVELMDGQIDVDSLSGKGSRFWFTMRLARAPQRIAVGTASPASSGAPVATAETASSSPTSSDTGSKQQRILLVEDNSVNQLLARRVLTRAGYVVDVANDGKQAVEIVRSVEPPYDLILMDCQMPVMDGYTATRAIRELGGLHAEIPIIALTAHAMKGDRDRCLEAGMDDYVAKPFDFADLRRVLAEWTASGRRARQS